MAEDEDGDEPTPFERDVNRAVEAVESALEDVDFEVARAHRTGNRIGQTFAMVGIEMRGED